MCSLCVFGGSMNRTLMFRASWFVQILAVGSCCLIASVMVRCLATEVGDTVGIASSYDEGWVTHNVGLSPDHSTVVRGRYHNELGVAELWIEDVVSGALRSRTKAWGVIRSFDYSDDGSKFVASADHGPLRVIDVKTGEVVAEMEGHSGWVHAVGFGADLVASAGRDETLRVWNAETGEALWKKDDTSLAAVDVSPDGSSVAATDGNGNLIIWDAKSGESLLTLKTGESSWAFELAFSSNGKFVASGGRSVRVFNVSTGEVLGTIDVDEKNRSSAIAISDDGEWLAAAAPKTEVKVWDVGRSQVEYAWQTPRSVGALSFSNDGQTLCGAQYSGMCHRWNLEDGQLFESQRKETPWIETETDVDQLMLSIGFFDTWRGIAVGGDTEKGKSIVMISVDDGQSWCKQTIDADGRLYSIDVLDNETAVAVGYGVVIRTRDRGENWEVIEIPAKHWLAGVDFVDLKTGYAVGGSADHPVLWKTTDGGDTWTPIHERLPENTIDCQLRDVKFLDEDHGFAVGTDGLLLETTDAGETWVRRNANTDRWLRAIHVNGDVIHVAGKAVLLRSEDSGKTWSTLPIPEQRKLIDVAFVDENHGWITNFDGEILETRDAGQTWNAAYKHEDVTTAIHFDSERVLVTTGDGKVLRQRR